MKRKINEKSGIDRRHFMKLAAGTAAGISLGLLIPNSRVSLASGAIFPEPSCGGELKMKERILVAYASEYGSTAGVAEAIGKELCNRGLGVDLRLAKKVADPGSYRAAIVGSPIYKGKWMPEAVKFLQENSTVLSRIPVAYFTVCMTMYDPTEENRRKASAYMDTVYQSVPQVKPVKVGLFAGALDYSKLSWIMRQIIKAKGSPEGDYRDWDSIRSWAANLNEVHGSANTLRPAPGRV